jgi:hypothetical protein
VGQGEFAEPLVLLLPENAFGLPAVEVGLRSRFLRLRDAEFGRRRVLASRDLLGLGERLLMGGGGQLDVPFEFGHIDPGDHLPPLHPMADVDGLAGELSGDLGK